MGRKIAPARNVIPGNPSQSYREWNYTRLSVLSNGNDSATDFLI